MISETWTFKVGLLLNVIRDPKYYKPLHLINESVICYCMLNAWMLWHVSDCWYGTTCVSFVLCKLSRPICNLHISAYTDHHHTRYAQNYHEFVHQNISSSSRAIIYTPHLSSLRCWPCSWAHVVHVEEIAQFCLLPHSLQTSIASC